MLHTNFSLGISAVSKFDIGGGGPNQPPVLYFFSSFRHSGAPRNLLWGGGGGVRNARESVVLKPLKINYIEALLFTVLFNAQLARLTRTVSLSSDNELQETNTVQVTQYSLTTVTTGYGGTTVPGTRLSREYKLPRKPKVPVQVTCAYTISTSAYLPSMLSFTMLVKEDEMSLTLVELFRMAKRWSLLKIYFISTMRRDNGHYLSHVTLEEGETISVPERESFPLRCKNL
ncbi:hypothetical protein J6590_074170 [Homalodisca vitripennis]|nr:hypothetical protein J6590_074170 [Homalodisca vitripennis]